MGLLSDPAYGSAAWVRVVQRVQDPVCALLIAAALGWFVLLAHPDFSNDTYFSENALLPGLVTNEFHAESSAKQFYKEFLQELEDKYSDTDEMPVPWLVGQMSQLHLEVYTHNFTLNYPLGHGQVYRGTNVYGILRAPRSGPLEALVLAAPYRAPSAPLQGSAAGLALMLAFARFARSQKYWAKDIIFLVTEHEQLGMQAWLEAYHGLRGDEESFYSSLGSFRAPAAAGARARCLDPGELPGRSGSIQAAINLEFHIPNVKYVEVKVEGLNGQLPNLDLVNLVHKLCVKAGVHHSYKNSYSWQRTGSRSAAWGNGLRALLAALGGQLPGVPNGNHGLFHRFGVEAVSLEGREAGAAAGASALPPASFHRLGLALESILRSLNNLLERFHQSYFFYLRPATNRFISIGQYMPCVCLVCAALLLKGLALWAQGQGQGQAGEGRGQAEEEDLNLVNVGVNMLFVHFVGYLTMQLPMLLTNLGAAYLRLPSELSLLYGLGAASLAWAGAAPLLPRLLRLRAPRAAAAARALALLELAALLLALALHNAALGLAAAALLGPLALLAAPGGPLAWPRRALGLLLHPLAALGASVWAGGALLFPAEAWAGAGRALDAAAQALMFAVVDGLIYGNWLFSVACCALLPVWTLLHQQLWAPAP